MSVTFLDQSGAVESKKQPIMIRVILPFLMALFLNPTRPLADGKKSDGRSVPLTNQSSLPLPDLTAKYATLTESHQSSSSSFNGAQFNGYEEGNGSLDDLVSSFPRRSVIFRNAIYPLCDEAGGNHPYSFVTSDSLPNINCLMPISG